MRLATRVVTAAATVLACACGGEHRGGAAVTITDSAGIELVRNVPADGTEPREAHVDLAIGVENGNPEYTFGDLVDVAVDRDGRLLALDRQAQELRIFDRNGHFVTTVGGPGEGPGELTDGIVSVAVSPSDSMYVADYSRGHINVYDAGGRPARAIAVPAQTIIEVTAGDEGTVLGRALHYRLDDSGVFRVFDALMRIGPADGALDTLFVFDYEPPDMGTASELRFHVITNVAFWDRLTDGTVAWSALDRDRVFIQAPSGGIERIVSYSAWQRRPVTERERAAVVAYYDRNREARGLAPGPLPPNAVIPTDLPAITAIRATPGGGFWVQRMGEMKDAEPMQVSTNTGWLGGPVWDTFDSRGRFLGTVRVPDRVRVTRVTADGAIGIQRDTLDVERVVRLRVAGRE